MSRRILLMPLLAPLAIAGACYGYYPVEGPSPVGREMQVNLTDSGAVVLARQIGPAVQAVTGRVTADSANAVVVSLSSVIQRDGGDMPYKGEHLAIARPLIASMSERRFSRARTALFSGAIAVALVAVRQAFHGDGSGSAGNGLPGSTGRK